MIKYSKYEENENIKTINKEKFKKRRELLIKMKKEISKYTKINRKRKIISLEYASHHYIK